MNKQPENLSYCPDCGCPTVTTGSYGSRCSVGHIYQSDQAQTEPNIVTEEEDITGYGLPLYQCHKKVRAGKIQAILHRGENVFTLFVIVNNDVNKDVHEIEVSEHYIERHNPKVNGYFIVYNDGYQSYSPAKPFENGYTLCESETDIFYGMSERESIDCQLNNWVEGNPLHNTIRDECCPDFSCCGHAMWERELREYHRYCIKGGGCFSIDAYRW